MKNDNLIHNSEESIWLIQHEASQLLNVTVKTLRVNCRKGLFSFQIKKINNKTVYFILLNSLPLKYQDKYFNKDEINEACITNKYSESPEWAKLQAEKYVLILQQCKDLKGSKLKEFIEIWNNNNPNLITSYQSINRMRKRFEQYGISGLLAQYGKRSGNSKVQDKYFEYFKNLCLVEGAPSFYSCWENTMGLAIRNNEITKDEFPCYMSFRRRLEKEVPLQSIYLARYGQSKWNKKYGTYIERDYSTILCGKVWVADHAQIDVACLMDDGRVVFPWVTAWRDFKSSKWLGWILQPDSPNSDHIFQSFYYSAEEYGLPTDVLLDNGKDFRCRDFAGGRKVLKVDSNEAKTTSMLAELNVKVHLALPYNAQTKPIERDFLKIKELLSKHCIGYRGGNVVERPEKLADEIKKGKLIPFNTFKEIFDDFIINILNKRPSRGKNLKGLSPDELFNSEFKEKITVSKDALKLFCMRTSKTYTVGRNGIKDGSLDITYWADWMISHYGLKVYLRRDIKNYKEAWVFKDSNSEFIGKVYATKAIVALNAEEISKDEFKEAISNKKRIKKVVAAYAKQTQEIGIEEQCQNYKAAYLNSAAEANPKVSKIANTNMDKAVRKNREQQAIGKQNLSILKDFSKAPDKFYLFETDLLLEQELKGVKYGY